MARPVLAIDCGDFTGVATRLGDNTVVAVLPSAAIAEVNLGAIVAPRSMSG